MSTLPSTKATLPRLAEKLHLRPPTLPEALVHQLPRIIEPLASVPPLRRLASKLLINHYSYATSLRPRALTLESDYTTWTTLTDRRFTGRHLPPADPETIAALPAESDVNALYRREREIKSTDTSVWFMFFAQWFTDSFLRTSRDDFRQNTSTQEIDLCQIYGLGADQTRMLRSMSGGRLKSQQINGEEFPVFLFQEREPGAPLAFKPEFDGLFDERFVIDTILGGAPDESKDSVFAVGLEHGNATIGSTILNILFLREHNRIATLLAHEYPDWDDDRLFETTRMIMIVLELKLVVEEYIRHIGPFDFAIETVPFIADDERWNRPNWIAIEFNLLYRWHSLVPDVIGEGAGCADLAGVPEQQPAGHLAWAGVAGGPVLQGAGREDRAAEHTGVPGRQVVAGPPLAGGAHHRPDAPGQAALVQRLPRVLRPAPDEELRRAHLRRGPARTAREAVHDDIDSLEWYVGIFAEDYPDYLMMGELLTTMVANDAFTQALSNPLLARNVFTEATFSPRA